MKPRTTLIIILLIVVICLLIYFFLIRREKETVAPETATVTLALPEHPGFPSHPNANFLIEHTHYTLSYNEKYEQPDWVMYKLTAEWLNMPSQPRSDDFREDPAVPSGSASLKDYKGSGYDRGHLLPAADMNWSAAAMSETFFMSNMSPQAPSFNRGIWKQLEEQVRKWAEENREIYVVTGPVLKGDLPTIGQNQVAVPQYYYKVILDYKEPRLKGIGFVMANRKLQEPLAFFVVTIDSVERLTGLDFFSTLPDTLEDRIEKNSDVTQWPFH